MFTQWATRRLCKFLLKKRIGAYIRGDLDLEQLEVQLGSGVVQLNDVALNTDYINEQLADLPLVLKEGSVGSVTLKLHWKALAGIEIEVDELELVLAPRAAAQNTGLRHNSTPTDDSNSAEVQNVGLEADLSRSGTGGGCTYLAVQEGVRVVANLVESLLLGMHIRIRNVIVAFEEQPTLAKRSFSGKCPRWSGHASHSMLVIRIGYAEYGVDSSSGNDDSCSTEDGFGSESAILMKAIRFQGTTMEVLDVLTDDKECPSCTVLSERTAGGKVFGQPVPILVGEERLSGCIQLSIPWKSGCINIPKFNADISISLVNLRVTGYEIQQLLSLARSFGDCGNSKVANAQGCDPSQSNILSNNGLFIVKAADNDKERPGSVACSSSNPAAHASWSDPSSTALLPVTRFISDWVHWTDGDNQKKEEVMSEADFAASVDEFFECFDGTRSSQASLSSSGLWTWTCSAFSAITAASSLASGSVLLSQDSARQVEYDFKVKILGISAVVVFEEEPSKTTNVISGKHSRVVTGCHDLDGWDLDVSNFLDKNSCNSASGVDIFCKEGEKITKESCCIMHSEDIREDYLEACFSDIDLSLQVSNRHMELKVMVSQVDVSEGTWQQTEEAGLFYNESAKSPPKKIGSMSRSLQALVEDALPRFPISLSTGVQAWPRQRGYDCRCSDILSANAGQSKQTFESIKFRTKGVLRENKKKCFLRLSALEHNVAGHIIVKQHFPSLTGDSKDTRIQSHTNIEVHLQPLIVWLDASILNKIHKLLEMSVLSSCDSETGALFREVGGHGPLGQDSGSALTIGHPSGTGTSTRGIVDVDVFIPCLRLVACFPWAPGSRLLKDDLLCVDLHASATISKVGRPFLAVKLCNSLHKKSCLPTDDSIVLRFGDSSLYLVSVVDNIKNLTRQSNQFVDLAFSAQKVLNISECNHKEATLEIRLRGKSSGGVWIAERAWIGVMEQQKGGMRGNGTGKSNSEFAAATATEVVEENNCRIREDIILCSSVFIHASFPHVRFDLFGSQHVLVLSLINSFLDFLLPENGQLSHQSPAVVSDSGSSPSVDDGASGAQLSQTSISVDVGEIEMILHPEPTELGTSSMSEREGNRFWNSMKIVVQKFQLLSVLNLGMISNASYLWLRHEDGHAWGSFGDVNARDLLLLSCRNDALGRGDGGGGNALATGSAGIEITVIAWPGRHHLEDVLITAMVRGGTFVAHGGRLDWLPTLISFFCQSLCKGSTQRVIVEKGCTSVAETSLFILEASTSEVMDIPSNNCTFFSLDLHDVALCYEPGKEALIAANIRAGGMAETQAGAVEAFSPVACTLAAAAVRVSSNAISSTASKEYRICLRDVALLLLDTTLRENGILDYTPEALHRAGYVKVAGEAVMEAVVRINGEEGLQWEVECANNQLRLDTCHDTTAALGRLVAQLQQLFVPDIEHSTIHLHAQKPNQTDEACSAGESFSSTLKDTDSNSRKFSKLVNGGKTGLFESASSKTGLFESVLEDAFTFIKDSPSKQETTVQAACGTHDNVDSGTRRAELLGTFELLGRCDLSSDVAAEEIPSTSLEHVSPDGQTKDFCTPNSQNNGLPSFIEDYYLTKNIASHASGSSRCKQSGEFSQHSQGSADEASALDTVEGNGGWYEGHTLKVLENHVPDVKNRLEFQKQRGSLSHSSKKRLGLTVKYPQSTGRVVLQDLNLRWRLYGGSDWPGARAQEPLVLSNAHQRQGGRQLEVCLEVILDGVELQHDTFPDTGPYASRLAVCIRDVGVYDCSKDAPWKKVLGYHRSSSRPRESSAQALKLELEAVRPDPSAPFEEYRLLVDLLPILLHLDQRHLDFFINFFPPQTASSSPQLHFGYEEMYALDTAGVEGPELGSKAAEASEEALLPFFQICELQPFTIRVDYVPRRVDLAALRGGNYAELFNLVSWKGIELQLKHVRASGVHGWGTLSGIVVGEWLEDISRNQIHKLIRGLGPIRPLFAVGSGAAKLIVLPAEHYRRDRRRLLRGMRKGAIAFLRSISLEAVGLGVQLAAGAHEILLHTESALGAVSLSTSLASERAEMPNKISQPGDTREGLQQACESLTRGLERTASSLIGNPLKVYQRGAGTTLAVASALRAAPAAALAPASAAAGAVHRALLGVRNSLDPEHKRESEEKHSGPPPE